MLKVLDLFSGIGGFSLGLERTGLQIEADLGATKVWADQMRVRQILRNLLSNADRHGGDVVRVSSEELDDGDWNSFDLPHESEDTARDVMTAEIYAVDVDSGLKEIATTMHSHRIHRVLVQEAGKHVGLISTMEILAALSA